jgi:integrase
LARIKEPVPTSHRRLAFTYDDVHRVLETIRDETIYAFSFLLLNTGLPFSESRDLQLAEVDFARDQLRVRSGKGDKSRQVPLHQALRNVLARHIETIRPDAIPLFCEDSGRPVNPAKFRRVLKEASNRCLGRILRPHDIRVTFASTDYHVHQTDILTIMRLLGHSDVRTTQHYFLPSHDIAHSSVNRLKRTDD